MPRLPKSLKFKIYNVSRYFLTLGFIIILTILSFYLLEKKVLAESKPLPTPYVPCNQTRSKEFHSLRPYQASPCNQDAEDLALSCGNDFILSDSIKIIKTFSSNNNPAYGEYPIDWTYTMDGKVISPTLELPPNAALACRICREINGIRRCVPTGITPCAPDLGCQSDSECSVESCDQNADGTESCTFIVERSNKIAIDLSEADLPIMGYTEPSIGNESDPYKPYKVTNSVNQEETLSDPDKVNEYVSWYLNGTIGRAEYDPPDKNLLGKLTDKGKSRIINYSGPLKKLLSFESQIIERKKQVNNAETSISSKCNPNDKNPSDPDCIRHNQIIGCRDASGNPIKCYPENPLFPNIRLTYWADKFPPLQHSYKTSEEYAKALENWKKNTFSKLFSYIPFSSTEDRLGKAELSNYTVQPATSNNVVILRSEIKDQKPADLFFSHMQENVELAEITQKIFSPQEADLDANPWGVAPLYAPQCNIVSYKRNPSDDLFASEITATVEYTSQITCTFTTPGVDPADSSQGRLCSKIGGRCYKGKPEDYECDKYYNQVDCPFNSSGVFCGVNCKPYKPELVSCSLNGIVNSDLVCFPKDWEYEDSPACLIPSRGSCNIGYLCGLIGCISIPPNQVTISDFNYTEVCENNVLVSFRTITKSPLVDEVWARLVSGPAGVFRRIFPKISTEEGRPIKRLWDLPAASPVTYKSLTPNVSVVGGSSAKLFFPHIGGVHEYFLNCIQKTLRPQGYGQGCISGPESSNPVSDQCPSVPDDQILAKYQGEIKLNFIRLANIWTSDCPGPENNLAEECYNYVVSEATKEGVNPAFALTIWLNESGASNYCHGGPTTQDMGINLSSIYQNLVEQLNHFLGMAKVKYCEGMSGFTENMHRWLSRFQSSKGICDPNDATATKYYKDVRDFTWQVVTQPIRICVTTINGQKRFGIDWPTDDSCP